MICHKTNAELSADARRSLLGHLGTAVGSLLLFFAITMSLNQIFAAISLGNRGLDLVLSLCVRFVTSLFGSLFGIGLASVFLNLQYGHAAAVRNLFCCFSENADKAVRMRGFLTAGEMLCLLPFQILLFFTSENQVASRLPLILPVAAVCFLLYGIWTLTFSMANYLFLDFTEMEPSRILRASRNMMRGNRIRLFCLLLRSLPLHLLGVFSFGVANLYAGCNQYACVAAFYKDMMTQARR
jgi:uncharacterized membrane protein